MTAQMDRSPTTARPSQRQPDYTDHGIFEEEIERSGKTWLATVHESELPNPLDFRT
jgi:hypothetical protein